jgi:hypothetical protein
VTGEPVARKRDAVHHARMKAGLACLLALASTACGGGSETQNEDGVRDPASGDGAGGGESPPVAADTRVLGAGATFADLVSAARRLDDTGRADSDAGCILRGSEGLPWKLEADLSVAVRPVPEAPADLDERLGRARGAVRVLTRWGALGAEGGDVALVGLTSTFPLRESEGVALFLTDRGVWVRDLAAGAEAPAEALPLDDAAARVLERIERVAMPVFVTAEAGIPLGRVRQLLAALPTALSGLVAIAVPLAEETRLPETTTAPAGDRMMCPDGLPAPTADMQLGNIAPEDIIGSLTPLRDGARQCFDNTTGPAALGGRLVLHFRIGPEGQITEGCYTEDDIDDITLRTCVREAARATRFPAAGPSSFVDAALPLVFTPDASLRQAALCE